MPKKKSVQLKEICVNIGTRIRNRRLALNMTRKAFASGLGLSQASVSNIERGKQSVSAEKLWHIALILACSPGELLPPIPKEHQIFEKQLKKIAAGRNRKWAEDMLKNYQT